MRIRARTSNFQFLIAVALAVTFTAALAIGLTVWWLHSDAIDDASRDSSNLAVVLAEQLANSIQSIDLVLTEIKSQEEIRGAQTPDDFDHALRSEDTYQLLMERLSHLQQAELIGLVDKTGRLVN